MFNFEPKQLIAGLLDFHQNFSFPCERGFNDLTDPQNSTSLNNADSRREFGSS